jgi:TolB-like protein
MSITAASLGFCLASLVLATPDNDDNQTTRLAIMALSADGVPLAYAVGLTETVATSLAKTGVFETISPKQVSSVLAYEKRRDALGDCDNEDCYTQIAKMVRAQHLISGSVAQVGETIVVNLALIDAAAGKVTKRIDRKFTNPAELMLSVDQAAIALVQPILSAQQGFLKIASNVPNAQIYVDDELRIEGVGQIIALSAGPHVLKVVRDGFYRAATRFSIKPNLVHTEKATLIPAKETMRAYETKANAMRYSAYAAGLLAIGAGVMTGVFYDQATDDKLVVDRFASALEADRAIASRREEAITAQDGFDTNQSLYVVSLSTVVLSAATSFALFLFGEDPDRYEAFTGLERKVVIDSR